MKEKPILVIGATGYVANRLIPQLTNKGYRVRAVGRSLSKLKARAYSGHHLIEAVEADVLDRESLRKACEGCSSAFYLVHSMNPDQVDFRETDRRAAEHMAWAAEASGLDRIVYLGGLGEESSDLSKHLRSRAEVGDILKTGRVPVTIFRAAMIIGAGSASFEIMRYLVDRLPVMITPRWVSTESQPITISNVIHYLSECLEVPETIGETFDIGGPEIITYRKLMEIYAEEARLPRRRIFPVPVLTPRLSSYWIHLVTPVPAALAKPLAEGLKNRTVCSEERIKRFIPLDLMDCRTGIRRAIIHSHHEISDDPDRFATADVPPEGRYPGDAPWSGGTKFHDRQRVIINGNPEDIWKPLQNIGGKTGWYYANWLWKLRGLLDRLLGGVGFTRRRSSQETLSLGDTVDFWTAKIVNPEQRLMLVAEMKLPGCAILDFKIVRLNDEATELQQRTLFVPSGQAGIIYWYMLYPFHRIVFRGMLRQIAKRTGQTVIGGPFQVHAERNT